MDQLTYFNDGKAMGFCYVLAGAYSLAMVRLDQLDEIDPLGLQHPQERQQLQALLDLCHALARVEEARIAHDRPEVVA